MITVMAVEKVNQTRRIDIDKDGIQKLKFIKPNYVMIATSSKRSPAYRPAPQCRRKPGRYLVPVMYPRGHKGGGGRTNE